MGNYFLDINNHSVIHSFIDVPWSEAYIIAYIPGMRPGMHDPASIHLSTASLSSDHPGFLSIPGPRYRSIRAL